MGMNLGICSKNKLFFSIDKELGLRYHRSCRKVVYKIQQTFKCKKKKEKIHINAGKAAKEKGDFIMKNVAACKNSYLIHEMTEARVAGMQVSHFMMLINKLAQFKFRFM